jgi:hypothetical protein
LWGKIHDIVSCEGLAYGGLSRANYLSAAKFLCYFSQEIEPVVEKSSRSQLKTHLCDHFHGEYHSENVVGRVQEQSFLGIMTEN